MRLLLVRHGRAEDRATWRAGGGVEARRPLTEDGARRMREASRGVAALVPGADLVATSRLTRARETASIVARALRCATPVMVPFLGPAGLLPGAVVWLAGQARARRSLVVAVGHEPHLGRLATWLVSGVDAPSIEFRKGGAALLDLGDVPAPGRARLEWLLTPGQLRRLGR